MDVFDLDRALVADYASFARSFTQIRAADIRDQVNEIYASRRFWPEPLITVNPHFERGASVEALVRDGSLHPDTARVFRVDGQSITLYRHQMQAVAKATTRQSFAVTTGTGSGKSLCFFIPIIDAAIRARASGEERRTRAIVIYPMNALANSQREELTKFLDQSGLPENLRPTFARYTGHALRAMPEDSTEDITAKRRRFETVRADPRLWAFQIAADLYTAAFLVPKTGGVPANRNTVTTPTTAHVCEARAGRTVYGPLTGRAQDLAGAAHAFHWPLEFPDVMGAGGFDVALGNPPWERIKLQEQEFFAAREREIAEAPNAAARGTLIAKLKDAAPGSRERALHEQFEAAKRTAEAASVFARVPKEDGSRFPLTGRGDVNTYALFAELFATLAGPRGRAGVIVPTGIATDATTAPFFASLVKGNRLAELIDFENRERLFPTIDSRIKLSLLTIGRDVRSACFSFFLTDPTQLQEPERRFTLSAEDIARINPNTKTAPVFRSRADAELTAKIYARVPVLIDEAKGCVGNPWGMSFHTRIWHMAEDAAWFRTATQLSAAGFRRDGSDWIGEVRYLPLYEAKMGDFYDHRASGYDERGDDRGYRVLPDTSISQHMDPAYEPSPFYWVPQEEVIQRLQVYWKRTRLLGFKNITSPTNERTFICNLLPRWGVGNSMTLLLPNEDMKANLVATLVGNVSSVGFDYFARQKAGGLNLNFFYVKQFPILSPTSWSDGDLAFTVPRVLELTYTSHAMAPFARDLGFNGPPFAWEEERRTHLRAELDAFYARAYGLSRDELRYILDPEDAMGAGYPSETFRVLKTNEIRRYGEYRTARLVLAAWDAQEARPAAAQ